MPIYEFKCSICHHIFEEIIFKSSDVDEIICTKCNSKEVKKLMSLFSSNTKAGRGGSTDCGTCSSSPSKCASCH